MPGRGPQAGSVRRAGCPGRGVHRSCWHKPSWPAGVDTGDRAVTVCRSALIACRPCPRLRRHVLRCPLPITEKVVRLVSAPDVAFQRCISPRCAASYGIEEVKVACTKCGDLLDVVYDWDRLSLPDAIGPVRVEMVPGGADPLNFSGVWRFRELLPFATPEQRDHGRRRADDLAAGRRRRLLRAARARLSVSCNTRA